MAKARGLKNKSAEVILSDNSMQSHVSEFETGTYKRAHRHGPGSHVLALGGVGYSLMWTNVPKYSEAPKQVRVDWKDGAILSPAEGMYHQHFNGGAIPARYLALRLGGNPEHITGRNSEQEADWWAERAVNQIEYQDEDPTIRREYEAEIAKHGLKLELEEDSFRVGDTLERVRRGELH